MKKISILIIVMLSIMITGCTKSEEPKKEVATTIVYCDSCGEESKEVTKFCSNCGEEAKWLAEKPKKAEISNNKDENKEKETIKTENIVKIEEEQCTHCSEYFRSSELNRFEGEALCENCDNLPKNCATGFERICQGCYICMPEPTSKYSPSEQTEVIDERVCLVCGTTFEVGTPGTFTSSGPDYCSTDCKQIGDEKYN